MALKRSVWASARHALYVGTKTRRTMAPPSLSHPSKCRQKPNRAGKPSDYRFPTTAAFARSVRQNVNGAVELREFPPEPCRRFHSPASLVGFFERAGSLLPL